MIPLSYNQKAMWVLHQLHPDFAAYNFGFTIRIHDLTQPDILNKTFNYLVQRHPILRTIIRTIDGEPVQIIQPVGLDFGVVDAGNWSPDDLEKAIEQSLQRPFDLERDHPLRVNIYTLAAGRVVLEVVFNHIAMDGWSLWVLLDELAKILAAINTGREIELPPLRAHYPDFVGWQNEYLNDDPGQRSMEFWQEVLADDIPALTLPTDFLREKRQNFATTMYPLEIDPETTARLRNLAQEEGLTLYEIMLTAFQIFLHHYSGQNDIAIGTPAFGRKRQFAKVVGLFVNTIILRGHIQPTHTFRHYVQQNNRVVKAALAHQHVPFSLMVEQSKPERDLSHVPIIQYMVNFIRPPRRLQKLLSLSLPQFEDKTMEFGGLTVSDLVIRRPGEQFDLNLEIIDLGDSLYAVLGYDNVLFAAPTITWMANHFLALLKQISQYPDKKISRYSLITPTERQLQTKWNTTSLASAPPYRCLHNWVANQAAIHSYRIAVRDQTQYLTYGELEERSNQLAHYLQKEGVGVEDVVGVLLDQSIEMVVAVLGILKAGAAFLPLDPDFPADRLHNMLAESNAVLLISRENSGTETTISGKLPVIQLQDPAVIGQPTSRPSHSTTGRNLAAVLYTAGSTDGSSAVQIEHRQIANMLLAVQHQAGLKAGDKLLAISKLAFDISILELFWPLISGAQVVIAGRESMLDGRRLITELQTQQITVMVATPSIWSLLIAAGLPELPALRMAIIYGEAVARDLVEHLLARGIDLYYGYGATATTILSALTPVANNGPRITIGRPLANTQIHILDRVGQPVPVGVVGELSIGSVGVTRGYIGRPGRQATHFQPDPFSGVPGAVLYRTGDLARRLPDGRILFLGRADFQVRIKGNRIDLPEIEARLRQHPAVAQAVVISDGNDGEARQLQAYMVNASQHAPPGYHQLRSFLQTRLPTYMLPAHVVWLDAIPLTANHKVDYQALPRPQIDKPTSLTPAFHTGTEKLVAEIWAETLYTAPVDRHDNFFQLGGHSLLATQVVSRIEKRTGISLPLRTIFEQQTLADLAREIDHNHFAGHPTAETAISALPREETFALSYAQERMWFLHQLAPVIAAYHIPIAIRIQNKVDIPVLEKALNTLVKRHESLRTIFLANEGIPQQKVLSEYLVHLRVLNLSATSPENQEKTALQLIHADIWQSFNLTQTPPWRVTHYSLGENEVILSFVFHHIIFDQWSTFIFWRELLHLYDCYDHQQDPQLPPLTIQYGDYALWQRGWLQESVLARLLSFWKPRLAGIAPLDLPTDRPRPPVQTFHGAAEYLFLSSSFIDKLLQASRQAQVTLFMFLLSAFKVLLMHYTRQMDIAVGVPVANRHRYEVEPIIGTFVNTLVVRTKLENGHTFARLMQNVRDELLAVYANQDMPFEQLVRELDTGRDLSRNPLVQVFFNMTNTPFDEQLLPQLPFSVMTLDRGAAQVDLTITATLEKGLPEKPHFMIEYNTDLFERETIQRFLQHYQVLLNRVLENAHQPIYSYDIMTSRERAIILEEWNATRMILSQDSCLHDLVARQARQTPEKVAVTYMADSLTYRELDERSNQLAHYLRGLGIGPEQVVGLMVEPGLNLVVGLLGILKAGGAYLPLDPHFPTGRLSFMIADAAVKIILTESRIQAQLPAGAKATFYALDTHWPMIARQRSHALPPIVQPDNLAYVIYTSGSTGRPKGVQIEHRQVVNFLTTMQEEPGIRPEDILLSVTTLSFDISVLELFLPLIAGARLVLVNRLVVQDSRELARSLERHKATIMQATPTTWSMLVEAGWQGTAALRLALSGGEILPAGLAKAILKRDVELWNMYGPTETTIWSSIYRVQAVRQPIPIGRPVGNTTFYILNSQGRPVPIGVPGELYIGGAGVARGYYQRSRLTADRFVPDPFANNQSGQRLYRTGDRARYLADGTVEILGRLDTQIKLRGHRVELGEIAAAILTHPAAREAVVKAHSEGANQQLVAYIIPTGNIPSLSNTAWRAYLGERLPDFMIPSAFIYLDSFPLTSNRKVDRKALPAPDTLRPRIDVDYLAPRNDVEIIMADILADLLELERVGIYDNFFELGGHSLQATRFVAQVGQAFRIDIPLWDFFRSPQIAAFAEHLQQLPGVGSQIAQIAQLRLRMAAMSEREVDQLLAEKQATLD